MMKVLIVGGGGREHALAWKIRKSQHVTWLGCTPGNGGINAVAEPVNVDANDIEAIARYSHDNDITLTVVGPEAPLADGIAELYKSEKHLLFGPSKDGAKIESSKSYSKDLMNSAGIPTAAYRTFFTADPAIEYIDQQNKPLVVKASGLAAGKGVYICKTADEAKEAVSLMMTKKIFGEAGSEIVIEDFLEGPEASILAITDGDDFILLPPSQDHKRIGEGDVGPNTGGMGAYSPAPVVDDKLMEMCANEVIAPTLNALKDAGTPYKGILYAGIMITDDGPKVLEFNCRFGDPETQVVLPMLSVDLVDLMLLSTNGKMGSMLDHMGLKSTDWRRISKPGVAATVVMAANGYPGKYNKGQIITNIPKESDNLVVFHAGTAWDSGKLLTSGGRVLAVTGMGLTLPEALNHAYVAANDIQFDGKYYRNDIGWRAL
jgi:phosphoribosylamine---glycine ligase